MTRVLVARLDNAGDVLLTGPAVRAVAAGAEHVTFVASRTGRAAAELLPGVDAIIEFDAPWVGFAPPPVDGDVVDAFVDAVRTAAIDKAFVCTSSHQSPLPLALLLRLAGVPWIVATSRDYAGSLLDLRRRPVAGDEHEVVRALDLVERAGFALPGGDDDGLRLRAPLPQWRHFEEPYVGVHPAASVAARAIDTPRAAAIVDALVDEGWCVAITGSPSEREITRAVAGASPRGNVVDLAGETDFATLAGVIAGANALVCGNTGPAHVAAAVGTPVVSVFAPVVPAARWRPWRVPAVLLGDQDIGCAGCRARTCPYPGQPCLTEVTSDAVVRAVGALAGRPRRLASRIA
jgi:ADP-heptose:LPS heptosyltransferase